MNTCDDAVSSVHEDGHVRTTERRAAARNATGYGVVVMNDQNEETPAMVSRALASISDRIG